MTIAKKIAVFTVFFLLSAGDVSAFDYCECNPDDNFEKRAQRAFGIFTGKVKDITTDFNRDRVEVTFDVKTSWRGVKHEEVKVYSERRGPYALIQKGITCGYDFHEGEEYLVFSYRDKNRRGPAFVGRCGGTKPLAEVESELRQLGEPVVNFKYED